MTTFVTYIGNKVLTITRLRSDRSHGNSNFETTLVLSSHIHLAAIHRTYIQHTFRADDITDVRSCSS